MSVHACCEMLRAGLVVDNTGAGDVASIQTQAEPILTLGGTRRENVCYRGGGTSP